MKPQQEIKPAEALQSQPAQLEIPPLAVLDRAIQAKLGASEIEALVGFAERWEKRQAMQEFTAAMAACRADLPVLKKTGHVSYAPKEQGKPRIDFHHLELGDVMAQINPVLGKHGLNVRWQIEQPEKNAQGIVKATTVRVTCYIAHLRGHEIENSVLGFADSRMDSPFRAVASAITYLQRYTLGPLLGYASAQDDDAQATVFQPGEPVPALADSASSPPPAPGPEPAREARAKPEYPAAKFTANLPAWRESVSAGKLTPAKIIQRISTRYVLTEQQETEIAWLTPEETTD